MQATIETLRGFARRGACTDAERRASLRLHDDLRAAGHEAWVETYWVRPKWPVALLLHAVLGVAASLAATAYPEPALAVALVTAVSFALEVTGRGRLLGLLFFRRATQVVVVEPGDPEKIALLITANVDAPRGGLLRRFPHANLLMIVALLGVAAAAGARALGAEGPAVGAPQFVPTLVLLLIAAAALDTALAGYAADDPSGVAAAVALHDALVRSQPTHLSPGLLLAGAGDTYPLGLRAHLRHERPAPEASVLLELGPCSEGTPGYATRHHQLGAACDWTRAELPDLQARAVRRRRPGVPGGIPTVLVQGEGALEFCRAMVDVLDADLGVKPFPSAPS
jgi:hypothetical protein